MLGLSIEQLAILGGVGLALFVLLLVLRAALKATKVVLRLGCVGILTVLIIVFAVLRVIGA